MGLIKGVLKVILSIVLILSLLTLVLSFSITKTLTKENFVSQAGTHFSENEEINRNLASFYNNGTVYFNVTNASSIQIPFYSDNNLTLERDKLKLPYLEFKQSMISELAGKVYDKTPVPSVYNTALKVRNFAFIVFLIALAAIIMLFSGRFMLLGINCLVTSAFYYPTSFIFNRFIAPSVTKNVAQDALQLKDFVLSFVNSIFSTSQTLFIYLAVLGVVLIITAILLKVLKVGLWFQGFFESKKKPEGKK
jgi:hypothetical protein